ncbi:MAG: hypothetical protein U0T84_12715 [Chitinophagales bacterium]
MTKANATEESLFTLASLYVLIRQHFNTIVFHEKHFSDFIKQIDKNELQDDSWVIEDTIYESLVHQIILKSCAFIDEWHKVFGIKTLNEDRKKILLIKKIVKPASTLLNKTIDSLRPYRNEAIAHNHRDKNGNVYLRKKKYDAPDSLQEIMLIVFCIDACVNELRSNFSSEFSSIINNLSLLHSGKLNPEAPKRSRTEIENIMNTIEEQINSSREMVI